MPRCSECGVELRTVHGLKLHWNREHPKKYEKRQSRKNKSQRLRITNLIEYWRKNLDASAHASNTS